jgi:DNA-binding CsgD family transcriptional regulator
MPDGERFVDMPLLERALECALMDRLVGSAHRGSGSFALIEGAAGVGKSSMLAYLRSAAGNMLVLHAQATPIERPAPFAVVTNALREALDQLTEAEREDIFVGSARLSRSLFDSSAPDTRSSDPHGFSRIHGLYWVLSNLSETLPVALLIDDLHWSDPSSLRFLLYLAHRVDTLPVVIAVTRRIESPGDSEELVSQLRAHPSIQSLRLESLSLDGTRDLLELRLGDSPTQELTKRAHELTGGNPFLLKEIADSLREGTDVESLKIAVTDSDASYVYRTIRRRLDDLSDEANALACAIAVLGDGTTLPAAAKLAMLDESIARDALGRLTERGLANGGARVGFTHPLIASAVYDEIPSSRRAAMHTLAAQIIDSHEVSIQRVASHLLQGDITAQPWALEKLRSAAHEALALGAPESAAVFLRRALEYASDLHLKAELLVELAEVEAPHDLERSLAHLREASEMVSDPRHRAEVHRRIGRALYGLGKPAEAVPFFELAMQDLQGEPSLLAEVKGETIAVARLDLSTRPRSMELLEEVSSAEAQQRGHNLRSIHVELALSSIRDIEPVEQALSHLGNARFPLTQPLEENGDGPLIPPFTLGLVWADQLSEARRMMDAVVEDAQTRGSIMAFATGRAFDAIVLFRMGQVDEAVAAAQDAIDAEPHGWGVARFLVRAWQAHAFMERGELTAAETVLLQAISDSSFSQSIQQVFVLDARARLLILQGRPAEAKKEAERARALAVEQLNNINPVIVSWRMALAAAHHDLGEPTKGIEVMEEEVDLARAYGAKSYLARSLRLLGLLMGGEKGMALVEESWEMAFQGPAVLARAWSSIVYGRHLRARGDLTKAREVLADGLRIASLCGSHLAEDRLKTELTLAGARPRREAVTGLASLTPGERRIVDLAASGLSNREIAEAQFVTVKAVEWHLGNAYKKLGVRSRAALPKIIAEAEKRWAEEEKRSRPARGPLPVQAGTD